MRTSRDSQDAADLEDAAAGRCSSGLEASRPGVMNHKGRAQPVRAKESRDERTGQQAIVNGIPQEIDTAKKEAQNG